MFWQLGVWAVGHPTSMEGVEMDPGFEASYET